ncbi:MAG: amidase family protein, partial [Candidatus Limnocylindrales bacterium]
MATGDELTTAYAHELAARFRAGDVSSREVTAAHLARAHRTDRGLHAWLTLDGERALAEADSADARLAAARGEGESAVDRLHPLLGMPVALKDLVSLKGGQCTAGSRILEGYRAPFDAHITERLRDAGVVILGKTNMDEFAMGSSTEHSAFGPTANPWDLSRVPGGSSGGSAASVAAFHAPLSIGTDTGGSIRQPAALCGIVGIKPTYGRVSRYGIVAFASSLDQIGPFGRDVRDTAAILHAVSGRDERDSTSAPVPVPDDLLHLPSSDDEAAGWLRGKRFGLPREYFVAGMEPGVEARVREAVAQLEAAGATVEEVSLPHTDYGLATYYIVAPAEASSNLA